MNKVEKIREEVEMVVNRRLNLLNGDYFDLNREVDGFTNEIMDIIDSLQEEPVSNDLEEAAHFYVDTTIEWFDSEGNPCCYPAFIAGAQWQKEQMMKNSDFINEIEWEDDIHKLFREKGKKVKLMIVEEE